MSSQRLSCSVVKPDIQEDTGCQQLCGGQISGIEAAVDAMCELLFEKDDIEAILLVNASNTFNTLNHQVALQNIRRLCPPLGTHFVNSYRALTEFCMDGEVFLSQEGTTQGDPLVISMYALVAISLFKKVDGNSKEVWYTDDISPVGSVTPHLREWWDKLSTMGPNFGYYANTTKTWLVTKKAHLSRPTTAFANTGVKVTCEGQAISGYHAIGSKECIKSYTESQVQ